MIRYRKLQFRGALALALALVAPASDLAAQSCVATITDISFGTVTPGATPTLETTGTLTIDCTATGNRLTVQACIDLGSGTGGATGAFPNISTRFMMSQTAPGEQLGYRLRRDLSSSDWNIEQFAVPQTSFGAGDSNLRLVTTVRAAITTPLTTVAAGDFSSTFSGLADAAIRAGNTDCSGAAQPIGPFIVSATLEPSCTISAGDLAFGLVPPSVTSPIDASSGITVNCSAGTSYSVGISLGLGPGVTDPANRLMTSGSNTLAYGLYRDAGRSLVWGDQPTNQLGGQTATGSLQMIPVYGRIPAGQTSLPGDYSDTVVITVEY